VPYGYDAGTDTAVADQGGETGGSGGGAPLPGDSGIDPASPTAQTEACIEYVRGYCERVFECGVVIATYSSCLLSNGRLCPDRFFSPGSIRTVESMLQCADQWRAMPCNALIERINPDCATYGTRAGGEICHSGLQCASGYCDWTADRCGVCALAALEGDPYGDANDARCVHPLYCDSESQRCAARLQIGDGCDPDRPGCLPNACATAPGDPVNRCRPFPRLGEDCSHTRVCTFGDSYCGPDSTCVALPGPGEPCGSDAFSGGEPGHCTIWESFCDLSLNPPQCRAIARAGEPCRDDPDGFSPATTTATAN
jgi:hypothetical protein